MGNNKWDKNVFGILKGEHRDLKYLLKSDHPKHKPPSIPLHERKHTNAIWVT